MYFPFKMYKSEKFKRLKINKRKERKGEVKEKKKLTVYY